MQNYEADNLIKMEWVTVLEEYEDKLVAWKREEYLCKKIGTLNEMNGHKHSKISKKKMSIAHAGKKLTEEHKKKIGKASSGSG